MRIFVAGAVTHVGKTTVCLSILAALRQAGFQPEELAYVKPATQCEAPDLLKHWCDFQGVEYVSGEDAPLVFFPGFTRSFLTGEQGTSEQWLGRISAKIDSMAQGRRVLIVDGVGFPAVGSIVGVDNADVARAARAPVLVVCKCGVGGAIDSFSLNSSYFKAKGVPVLGAIFNLGEVEGFYSWEKCVPSLKLWFSQPPDRRERYYGTVPLSPSLQGLREKVSEFEAAKLTEFAAENATHFASHVDLPGIIAAAALDPWCRCTEALLKHQRLQQPVSAAALAPASPSPPPAAGEFQPKSRSEVANSAADQGARGGG